MSGFEFFVEEAYGSDFAPETRVRCQCGDFSGGIYCLGHNLSELEIKNMKLIARAKVLQAMDKKDELKKAQSRTGDDTGHRGP